MKETWGKALYEGSLDVVKSVGNVLFSPPLSKEFIDLEAKTCEETLTTILNEILKEAKNNDSSDVPST